MKIPKSLEHMNTDTVKVLNWVASVHNYMKEVDDDLQLLKADLGRGEISKSEREIRKALRQYKYAGNSERKVMKFEGRMNEDIKQLMEILPEKFKTEIKNIEEHLRVSIAFLISNASLFEGHIKEHIQQILVQLDLLEHKKRSKVVDLNDVKALNATINNEINRLIERVELTLRWVAAMAADIERVQHWEEKLMKMAA